MNLDEIFCEVAALRRVPYQPVWPNLHDPDQCRCEDCVEYDDAEDRKRQS